ncbi:potassium transporter Kup [Enemella dayhoffiae]|uniref:Probable potassium transport system protein Kup n=1 Tax=Enemella dayhoffiae TaxID=2016507 RepID=A0A255H2H9_9ACTN|nr:potassium transporter Kup [Enemella dayhoffiae]OYO20784.1 potassium transporter Kup [Enemella dayhoffiae]
MPLVGLTALGVVFGDIGTSPLYSLQTVFSIEHNTVAPNPLDVYGVISQVFWAIVLVVTVKYVALVLRADNDGEGGILALVHLLRQRLRGHPRLAVSALMLGILGAALFYGDSLITPAISVMSAVEGLTVSQPQLEEWVLPVSVVILTALFAIQRWGTEKVGRAFGPVMLVWFVCLAALGIPHIVEHPEIVGALLPHHAWLFMLERPWVAFIAMGAVVLTITGAEALYADMGHFGARPIRLAWFAVVLPALVLNYLGQGAMILHSPETSDNPFFRMAPAWAQLPLVVLATVATVIASQAVISGAFSVSRQATRLYLLPRLTIRHTSKHEGGQIYVPVVNWILFGGVLVLIAVFQSSARLATAYGLAVTGTLLLTMLLFLFLAHHVWHWRWWQLGLVAVFIGGMEAVFFAANLMKLPSGGWIPLLIAAAVITVMSTWHRGYQLVAQRRAELEGPLDDFVEEVRDSGLVRIPGVAVVPHPDRATVPLALRFNVGFNRVLHGRVVIVSVVYENVPHIRHVDRVQINDLGYTDDGIVYLAYHIGFNDTANIPAALELARGRTPELDFEQAEVTYLLSTAEVRRGDNPGLSRWRKQLYMALTRNAASRSSVFCLPPERTVVMGSQITL